MQTKQCVIDNQLISYIHSEKLTDTKSQTAPILIFLHGWGCSAHTFMPLLKRCEHDQIPFVALDLPGFWGSPLPTSPRTIAQYTSCVHRFLQKIHLTDLALVLVWHSFGWRIAIEYTTIYTVQKLLLTWSAWIPYQLSRYRKTLKRVASYLRPLLRFFSVRLHEHLAQKLRSSDYQSIGAHRDIFLNAISYDQTSLLKHIHTPTLLLRGANDTETPLKNAHTMHQAIPNAQLIVYEQGWHFVFLEKTDQFYTDMYTFIHA